MRKRMNNEILYQTENGEVINLVIPNKAFKGKDGNYLNVISNVCKGKNGVITLSGDLQAIMDEAFAGCNNLISIDLPQSLESIGYGAFIGDTFQLKINSDNIIIHDGAFSECCFYIYLKQKINIFFMNCAEGEAVMEMYDQQYN